MDWDLIIIIIFQDALTILQQTEIRLSQFKSLKLKLADCQEAGAFAARLMAEPDGVPLLGGSHSAVGSVLHKALENSVRDFLLSFIRIRFFFKEIYIEFEQVDKSGRGEQQQPVPSRKEFILRCTAQRPGNGSTSSCQRMYCCIDQDSFRLAGAFTQDTLFYWNFLIYFLFIPFFGGDFCDESVLHLPCLALQ